VGEIIYSDVGIYNKEALNFLHELLGILEAKAKKEKQKEVIDFIQNFFKYQYSINGENERRYRRFEPDYEGGGLGIIHTIIDLGE